MRVMSKIRYPSNDTIANAIRSNVNDTISYLNQAISSCSFNLPDGFEQNDYLYRLADQLSGYSNRARSIYNSAVNVDRAYRNMRDSVSASVGSINSVTIEERDRLIR